MTKRQDPKAKAVSTRGNGYAEEVSISMLKANPSNPRVIRDEKFTKLVRSLVRFPTMLEKRPIVHVERVVLGGNQRLRAIETILGDWKKAAAHLQGLPDRERGVAEAFWAEAVKHKALPASCIADASGWTDEQRKEFIIKDNVGFGEWDYDQLANEWDAEELSDWGLDAPYIGHEVNVMDENELDLSEEFDPIGTSKGLQRVVFVFDSQEHATSFLAKDKSWKVEKFNNGWRVNLSSQSM